jgi:hypothetical protein
MGASVWSYVVEYEPDLGAAFAALQAKVLAEGDYWWAVRDASARGFADRPLDIEELFRDEHVQESGTHSILDMDRVLGPGEAPNYGWMAEIDNVTSPLELSRLFTTLGQPEYEFSGLRRSLSWSRVVRWSGCARSRRSGRGCVGRRGR